MYTEKKILKEIYQYILVFLFWVLEPHPTVLRGHLWQGSRTMDTTGDLDCMQGKHPNGGTISLAPKINDYLLGTTEEKGQKIKLGFCSLLMRIIEALSLSFRSSEMSVRDSTADKSACLVNGQSGSDPCPPI